MATKIDFLSENNDLLIQNGDFVIGNNTSMQASVIVKATKGEIRHNPDLGVGIDLFLGSTGTPEGITNYVQSELDKDDIELVYFEVVPSETGASNQFSIKMDVR